MTSYISLKKASFRIAINFNKYHAFRHFNKTRFYFEIWRSANRNWHIELFIIGKRVL